VKAQDIVLSPGVDNIEDSFHHGEMTPQHTVERTIIKSIKSPRLAINTPFSKPDKNILDTRRRTPNNKARTIKRPSRQDVLKPDCYGADKLQGYEKVVQRPVQQLT